MKKKQNLIIIGAIMLVLIIIVVVTISMVGTSNSNKNKDNTDKKPNKEKNNIVLYDCTLELGDISDGYISHQIESLEVKNNIVLSTTPTMEVKCTDENIYNALKNDTDYSNNKTFDDENKTVTYSNGDKVDLTVDLQNNKQEISFEDYKKELEKTGYKCSKK